MEPSKIYGRIQTSNSKTKNDSLIRLKKSFEILSAEDAEVFRNRKDEPIIEIEKFEQNKIHQKQHLTEREVQMNMYQYFHQITRNTSG